jgi:hypothetical protein
MESIQDVFSHADTSTTQRYIHSMARRNLTVEVEIQAEGRQGVGHSQRSGNAGSVSP